MSIAHVRVRLARKTADPSLRRPPQDVDIHPGQSLLATGVIDGHLVLHGFTKADSEQRHKVKVRRRRRLRTTLLLAEQQSQAMQAQAQLHNHAGC